MGINAGNACAFVLGAAMSDYRVFLIVTALTIPVIILDIVRML